MRNCCTTMMAIALAGTAIAPSAFADPASLFMLPTMPETTRYSAAAISADGKAVVGRSGTSDIQYGPRRGFRWTEAVGTHAVTLPSYGEQSEATAISSDGKTVVGNAMQGTQIVGAAFRWTESGGPAILPLLPSPSNNTSFAAGVSGNGVRTVGRAFNSSGMPTAVFWDNTSAPVAIGPGIANGASYDAARVVGTTTSDRAFLWTQDTGAVLLPTLPQYLSNSAHAISDDGNVVVGRIWSKAVSGGGRAFRWTSSEGLTTLDIPAGWTDARATATSADGSVIVGQLLPADITGTERPFYWTAATGTVTLASVLYPAVPAGWELSSVTGVSDDGMTFTGTMRRPGEVRAYVATIPAPSTMALLCMPLLAARRRR
jgi:hypothetical protein